jgi:hypothetical protein
MNRYGAEIIQNHRFSLSCREVEKRGQWLDVYLSITPVKGEQLPEALVEPSVLVICTQRGDVVQIVLQDEGCDCEYLFTLQEKAQIEQYIDEKRKDILALAK